MFLVLAAKEVSLVNTFFVTKKKKKKKVKFKLTTKIKWNYPLLKQQILIIMLLFCPNNLSWRGVFGFGSKGAGAFCHYTFSIKVALSKSFLTPSNEVYLKSKTKSHYLSTF